jgi:predicted transposase/invertase (TIGR01784 family)
MKKNKKEMISDPHDLFFKTAMEDKRVAREFLKRHLPIDLRKQVDFENLELQPGSFINDVRKKSAVDVLFKTTIEDKEIFIYLLLEHQSSPDELMPFRVLKYTCNIIDAHLKKYKTALKGKAKKFPFIYPMVIYHARKPYGYSTNINDLVDAPKAFVDQYFLKPFQLIDLGEIEDEQLKKHAWSGVMEFALKHIFARDLLPHIKNIANLLAQLDQLDGREFVEIVLQYFLGSGELKDREQFFELINDSISYEVGGDIMTLAEQFIEEGIEKGKLEVIKTMLSNGVEPAFIAKNTGVSMREIEALQKKL